MFIWKWVANVPKVIMAKIDASTLHEFSSYDDRIKLHRDRDVWWLVDQSTYEIICDTMLP